MTSLVALIAQLPDNHYLMMETVNKGTELRACILERAPVTGWKTIEQYYHGACQPWHRDDFVPVEMLYDEVVRASLRMSVSDQLRFDSYLHEMIVNFISGDT